MKAIFHEERYGLIEATTKAGKTVACLIWLTEKAMFTGQPGREYWWVAPSYAAAQVAFNRAKRGLPQELYTPNETRLRLTLANGAVMSFRSGEKPDSLYGEDVFAAVLDEASRMREAAWWAVRSTLTATQGPVRIIGNVKGRKNWFFKFARTAESDGGPGTGMIYAKITAIDAVKAGVYPGGMDEVEDARSKLPEHVFRELYMAEPTDDGSNPFGQAAIGECVAPLSIAPPVVWGWDLAKKRDWTVGIGLDESGAVCRIERWQMPWLETIKRIKELTGDTPALVDGTGAGDPILEALQRGGAPNFEGFVFTSAKKQQIMEGLAVAIQRREVRFPEGTREHAEVLLDELLSFEFVNTRTGVRYSAPEGQHDDCVCALALAWCKGSTAQPAAGVLGWMMMQIKAQQPTRKPDPLPWRQRRDDPVSVNVTVDLYQEARMKLGLEAGVTCSRCGGRIGSTRVTDGVDVWHPECR